MANEDNKSNAIHASIHQSDAKIGFEKNLEKQVDNAIHASIHKEDSKIGVNWIKKILNKK